MRIYLVGFMGSGKSTLGQRVALSLQVPYLDTDNIAEAQSGMSIAELFDGPGEDYFRHLEADILRQTTIYPKSINATGGGLPCFSDNMTWMNQHGITLYLQWPEDLLTTHLLKIRASKPLLAALSETDARLKIKELFYERKPVYERAAVTVEVKGELEHDVLLLEKACRYIW